jgi:hypothetical protein
MSKIRGKKGTPSIPKNLIGYVRTEMTYDGGAE